MIDEAQRLPTHEDVATFKQRQRSMWAAGDYPSMAEDIAAAGERLVDRLEVAPGERLLDAGCGSGTAARYAAGKGAQVTALDLTPELLAAGRRRAEREGLRIDWREGDVEALPWPDASFDVVISCFACMFAPRHEVAAAELARVLRPGGRLGICAWTPAGAIGGFFKTVAAHVPPPPWARPPLLWGTPEHVSALFAGTGLELTFDRDAITFADPSVDAGVDEFKTKFGPILLARQALEPEGRWEALEGDIRDYLAGRNEATDGSLRYAGEYLVTVGRR